jgi:large subunit ribosomal protein L10
MPTAEKVRQVEELEERFKRSQALVFTDFRGLSAGQMVELRRELRKNNIEYRVVKNRLAKLAAERAGLEIDPLLGGPTGICFGYDDPALAFKVAMEISKRFEHYVVRGGISEGELVDAEGAKELAQLPSREELLARLAAAFQGPIQNLAVVLSALLRELVVVLSEVAKVKPETAAEATASSEDASAEETTEGTEAEPEEEETPEKGETEKE